MALFIGLDVGTTNLGAVALETTDGTLRACAALPNTASRSDTLRGRAELDLDALRALLAALLRDLAARLGPDAHRVQGIGVTGQQHGMALIDDAGRPLGPGITWQDRRTLETVTGTEVSWLAQFTARAGGPARFERCGGPPAAGYLGPTLYWLLAQGPLPPEARVAFVPDVAVAWLIGQAPPCDPTDGGSSGVMDIVARAWDDDLLARLGLPRALFPPVAETGAPAGALTREVAASLGLPAGTPVAVALGDNQASFLGSVRLPEQAIALNVGTGAQISARIGSYQRVTGLDTRALPAGRYLLGGAGLFGGRSYSYLGECLRRAAAELYGVTQAEIPFDQLNRLAAAVPPGCDGLRCVPTFTGTRVDPAQTGSFTGVTPANLTPGHLARAVLEGMAEGFHAFYVKMADLIGERTLLVGSGNAIRRNPLFAQILSQRFGLPLELPALAEEASVGAALTAAVATGAVENWDAAAAVLPGPQAGQVADAAARVVR